MNSIAFFKKLPEALFKVLTVPEVGCVTPKPDSLKLWDLRTQHFHVCKSVP